MTGPLVLTSEMPQILIFTLTILPELKLCKGRGITGGGGGGGGGTKEKFFLGKNFADPTIKNQNLNIKL